MRLSKVKSGRILRIQIHWATYSSLHQWTKGPRTPIVTKLPEDFEKLPIAPVDSIFRLSLGSRRNMDDISEDFMKVLKSAKDPKKASTVVEECQKLITECLELAGDRSIEQAEAFISLMTEARLTPSDWTLNDMTKAYINLDNAAVAFSHFGQIVDYGGRAFSTSDYLLGLLLKEGHLSLALELLHIMVRNGVQPHTSNLLILIKYKFKEVLPLLVIIAKDPEFIPLKKLVLLLIAKSPNYFPIKFMIDLYRNKNGRVKTSVINKHLLERMLKLKEYDDAKEFLKYMNHTRQLSADMFMVLVVESVRNKNFEDALQIGDLVGARSLEMHQLYKAELITPLANTGNLAQGLEIFRDLLDSGPQRTSGSDRKLYEKAVNLCIFQLIAFYCQTDRIEDAIDLVELMSLKGFDADYKILQPMLQYYLKHDMLEECDNLLGTKNVAGSRGAASLMYRYYLDKVQKNVYPPKLEFESPEPVSWFEELSFPGDPKEYVFSALPVSRPIKEVVPEPPEVEKLPLNVVVEEVLMLLHETAEIDLLSAMLLQHAHQKAKPHVEMMNDIKERMAAISALP